MAAKYLGVQQIIAIDLIDERLKLAARLGATPTNNSRLNTDVVKSIKDTTNDDANFAIDCTGVGPRGVAPINGVFS